MERPVRKTTPRKPRATATPATKPAAARPKRARLAQVIELDHAAIAARAYDLFQRSGCEHGRDVEFWLEAERELQRKA